MLTLFIPAREGFNEETQRFLKFRPFMVKMEHSLISISQWEARWEKVFLTDEKKTEEERLSYVYDMCITRNLTDEQIVSLVLHESKSIEDYIGASRTATTISRHKTPNQRRGEVVTSELIYYWMVAYDIPFECQKWHLNRLLTLVEICNIKQSKDKPMSKRDTMRQNHATNQARRARLKSKG